MDIKIFLLFVVLFKNEVSVSFIQEIYEKIFGESVDRDTILTTLHKNTNLFHIYSLISKVSGVTKSEVMLFKTESKLYLTDIAVIKQESEISDIVYDKIVSILS